LKFLIFVFAVLFFVVGLVPSVNSFLKSHITKNEYSLIIAVIVYIVFEIFLYLKEFKKYKKNIEYMEEEVDFKKYKKESKYVENKSFYYRDFPFEKNIFKIFWIAFQYNIIDNRANILNALLLKWCKENRIRFNSNGSYEICNPDIDFEDSNEAALFYMLRNTSKNNFIKLTMFNSKFILKKINDILLSETSEFRKENKVVRINSKVIISDSIKPDVDVVFGFKNFLLNFSSIDDRNPQDVKLWDEYLIYAELLEISDEVKKQFSKLNINYNDYEIKIKKINKLATNFIKCVIVFSYLFYGYLFLFLTSFIWMIYINLTW
jgi:hypothetical protein